MIDEAVQAAEAGRCGGRGGRRVAGMAHETQPYQYHAIPAESARQSPALKATGKPAGTVVLMNGEPLALVRSTGRCDSGTRFAGTEGGNTPLPMLLAIAVRQKLPISFRVRLGQNSSLLQPSQYPGRRV